LQAKRKRKKKVKKAKSLLFKKGKKREGYSLKTAQKVYL